MFERVVLIGFSGTGKSTVARLLGERLGWGVIDTDADIERDEGISVPEIFGRHGEVYFRGLERAAMHRSLSAQQVVVATGGGAVVDESLWTPEGLCSPATLVVALDARPETMLLRLREQHASEGAGVERPMLAGEDPLSRIDALKAKRQTVYDRADITLSCEGVSPEHVAEEIVSIAARRSTTSPEVTLRAKSSSSDIYIREGAVESAGDLARQQWSKSQRAWIVSDLTVGALHGERVASIFQDAGFATQRRDVGVGESSKSWKVAGELLDWLLTGGIERGDIVIALGGGVIGDLAGFVAATALRGVGLVQIPTSLLAMVDSSIGGKTGINHATGKNLIGAFYQPPVVVIDPAFLRTLPPRELNAGWAEIIKHGVIQRSTPGGERGDLLSLLERNLDNLRELNNPAISYVISRNVALKAAVVQADERETGIRAYLNFGHTIGHAIEAADYALLHGEAVAVGMCAALFLGRERGQISKDQVARIERLIAEFGLPRSAKADLDVVRLKMNSDKKRVAGTQRWVLPDGHGGVELRTDVTRNEIEAALNSVLIA